ncbi:selection and upkeep of intraepithelial T-cells protein 8-like [Acanthochromis polyacanthus]|uniref:selection and upkeep of intraepithelial T-cells protein 8-like n=1 Tax=Acanthochromis polyacanthus TaxID=80966 RepID=UPI002234AA0D|nr:selection and upkeep of intraepithelial T-cells protein 8-like [Acanthochromis polyacanthus]
MAAGTRVFCFLIICSLVCSSRAQTNITAELGQDVNLTCKVPNKYSITIIAVQWIRLDQDPEYVLLYRDGHLDPEYQHPSYQNRVDLQNKEVKDGDASLILKKVKMEDTGTYECRVSEKGKKDPISITYLVVVEPGNKNAFIGDGGEKDGGEKDINTRDGGNKTGIIAGSVVGVILLAVAAAGFLIYRQHMGQNPNLPVPPDEAAPIEMLPVPEQHQKQPELV